VSRRRVAAGGALRRRRLAERAGFEPAVGC
jgi:hypothetical protein